MIAALLNRKSRVGKATLTLLLTGELTCKGNQFATFVVRPTTDMTTQERDRIAAFEHDVIVANTLREMLARKFPATSGETFMTGIAAPRMREAFPATHHATDNLIHVELTWVEKRIENWIRFGTHAQEQIVDRRRRILSFRPGTVFAFVRWAANDFGTIFSRIDIVRAVASGQAYQTLPFVRPGGDILLKVEGWPKVERVLQAIDAIQRLGIEPEFVSPDHWRHIHNRITAGHAPRSYTLDQHRAFLLRKRTEP